MWGTDAMNSYSLVKSHRIRNTPFSRKVSDAGAKNYTVYNHMLLPAVFRGVEEDYWHLLEHVQLWDVACQRQVEIQGSDAAELVQRMIPRDLTNIKTGQCAYTPLLDRAGGMLNDPVLLKLDENRYWFSLADSDIIFWAKGLASGWGFDVEISEPDVSPLAIQGPKAERVCSRLFGTFVEDIGFFKFRVFEWEGVPLLIARSGWSKQGGFEVYLRDGRYGEKLWDALWDAGQDCHIGAGCPNLIERTESWLLSFGGDMVLGDSPLECGLERYCDLKQSAEFLGKEALIRQSEAGVTRRLVPMYVDGDRIFGNPQWWPLMQGDIRAGEIRTVVYSPRLEKNIAIAMLNSDMDKSSLYQVFAPDCRYNARVTELPFI